MPGTSLSSEEIRLVKQWAFQEDVAPSEIATRLKRDKTTINRELKRHRRGKARQKRGRVAGLTSVQVDVLLAKLKDMIVKAKGRWEVTAAMLKRSARCKAGLSTVRKAIHKRGVYFYAMRLKPKLTEEDIVMRYQFGWDWLDKTANWWVRELHMVIDVKFFPVFLTAKARTHVAQSGCRGVYREEGEGLNEGYYKPNPRFKYNTGAKGVHVLAGVGNGKILLWEYIEGRWNSHEAARLYKGPMLKALQNEYPSRRRYNVLEDNDPTGFRSHLGMKAKDDAHIDTFRIPKHSPQLNVCDYFLWKEINNRMRATERKWADTKRETRTAYLRRLTRTAKSLPPDLVNAAVGHMTVRCQRLVDKEGGQIEG